MSERETKPDLAKEIVTRIVTNTIGFMWTRNLETLRDDPDEIFPTEEELLQDALGLALGEDIGCLDPEDEDFADRIDLLWVRAQLAAKDAVIAGYRNSRIGHHECVDLTGHPDALYLTRGRNTMPERKQLSSGQRQKIEDVIHCLNFGLTRGWGLPDESLASCIAVLAEARAAALPDQGEKHGE
jgi:hypothetical protein